MYVTGGQHLTSDRFIILNFFSNASDHIFYLFIRFDSAVLSGFVLMFVACILWMKLVSYAHTNYDIRALSKTIDKVVFMDYMLFFFFFWTMVRRDSYRKNVVWYWPVQFRPGYFSFVFLDLVLFRSLFVSTYYIALLYQSIPIMLGTSICIQNMLIWTFSNLMRYIVCNMSIE